VIKQPPSIGRIAAMVAFAMSCVGLLFFLWVSFGGPLPLQAKSYRLRVAVPEATTLALESDVRISGVKVGKVKQKSLDSGGNRTLLVLEIEPRYAPLPRDVRVVLRQKTLLGETFLELTPGKKKGQTLADGARLPDAQVEPTVQLDEIFGVFNPRTRHAFQRSAAEFAKAFSGPGAQALNDSIGNLEGTATSGERLLRVLDSQRGDLRRFVRNGSVVFGALNDRRGALRGLITNSNDTFGALASRDEALAETIAILPTFLQESRTTLRRVARFTDNSAPVVTGLQPVADDLTPTLHDLGALAPDLRARARSRPPARWCRRSTRSWQSSTRSSRCCSTTRSGWPGSSPMARPASTAASAGTATTTRSG
jgi:phospholipid/cholesterol/gamma-HCH transport system substrate-binding protein